MKNLITFLAIILLGTGCHKAGRTALIPVSPFENIPVWNSDTLIATCRSVVHTDTIFTYRSGDTCLIKYHGSILYVYHEMQYARDWSDSTLFYFGCIISPTYFDTANATRCTVSNPHPWDVSHNRWSTATFFISITKLYPNFDTTSSGYYY